MKKLFLLCLCLFLLLQGMPISAAATREYGVVLDEAALLSEAEEAQLQSRLQQFSEKTGAIFLIYTVNAYDYDDDDVVEKMGYDTSQDLILFGICRHEGFYYYNYQTYGRADYRISDVELDEILDAPSVYAIKLGKHASALESAVSLSQNAYGTILFHRLIRLIFAFLIALIAALIYFLIIRHLYRRKLRGNAYPFDHYTKLQLTYQQDDFLGKAVTRTRISSDSRGGGGGGGGSHRGRR